MEEPAPNPTLIVSINLDELSPSSSRQPYSCAGLRNSIMYRPPDYRWPDKGKEIEAGSSSLELRSRPRDNMETVDAMSVSLEGPAVPVDREASPQSRDDLRRLASIEEDLCANAVARSNLVVSVMPGSTTGGRSYYAIPRVTIVAKD
ncbi:unnamed protein product [Dovyalis caffra]|uniref:Uncharacterized protein n=1 Tax=Dovyalis caffra TaxID=77055 RepID=A0AAV1RIN3_9ROSI|nr:unnamed protein product [Dovyalis caffra]